MAMVSWLYSNGDLQYQNIKIKIAVSDNIVSFSAYSSMKCMKGIFAQCSGPLGGYVCS